VADDDVGKSEIACGAEPRYIAAAESEWLSSTLLLGEE
jgi:hypothetical protein